MYQQNPAVDRSRLTVFFRLFMVIPHLIWRFFYGIAAAVVVFIAWFAILFTGRYPQGMYEFVAGPLRFNDARQRLLLPRHRRVPAVRRRRAPRVPRPAADRAAPPEKLSRLTTFFRIFLLIPVVILLYIFNIWIQAVAIAIWLVAVIMGKTSAGPRRRHPLPARVHGARRRLRAAC